MCFFAYGWFSCFFLRPHSPSQRLAKSLAVNVGKNEINEGRKQYYHSLKLVNLRREKNLIGSRPHQLTLSFNFFLHDGCPTLLQEESNQHTKSSVINLRQLSWVWVCGFHIIFRYFREGRFPYWGCSRGRKVTKTQLVTSFWFWKSKRSWSC